MPELDLIDKIKNVEGFLRQEEAVFLYHTARQLGSGGVIVEIGSYKGKSTICLAQGSKDGLGITVFAVDPHLTDYEQKICNAGKSSFADFWKNIEEAGLSYLVTPIVEKSEDAIRKWNRPIIFLWIDGDHSYCSVKNDFDLWTPFLLPGGVVAFHDSTSGDVKKFVCKNLLLSDGFKATGIVGSITFGTKAEKPISAPEKIRNRFILLLNIAHDILRKIPLSISFRASAKRIWLSFLRKV